MLSAAANGWVVSIGPTEPRTSPDSRSITQLLYAALSVPVGLLVWRGEWSLPRLLLTG